MYYILTYDFVSDYMYARTPHRADHFAHIKPYIDNGSLLLGGALVDPSDKGVLVFQATDEQTVEEIAKQDPYVKNGVVTKYVVRQWSVVAGSLYEKSDV